MKLSETHDIGNHLSEKAAARIRELEAQVAAQRALLDECERLLAEGNRYGKATGHKKLVLNYSDVRLILKKLRGEQ